ncbi:MAG: hypothetical protein ABFS86_10140 [Planctomycetota bacterium]
MDLKKRIQREFIAREDREGEAEERERRREWLATSDSSLARLWREAAKRHRRANP